MEHSALHALELIGQVVALGGAFFVLWLVYPASRAVGPHSRHQELQSAMLAAASRWVMLGVLGAALATTLNLFVEAEETQGLTVFGGVSIPLVWKFAIVTRVGRLTLIRIGVLLLTFFAAQARGMAKWWLVMAGTLCSVVFTSLVSHAAAQPTERVAMMAAQVAHIVGAAVWVGVLIHLLASRRSIEGPAGREGVEFLSAIVHRFSPVALVVTSLLGLSGLWMIYRFLAEPSAVFSSAYGLTLMVKLLLLTPAIYAGWINFRIIRPGLERISKESASSPSASKAEEGLFRRFGRSLEMEVTAGVLVITAAGILASVSPPGEAGAYRLTEPQEVALEKPHLPVTRVQNPKSFYGAADRNLADLRYAEFTHNWSGVMVCLLGLGWLAQSARPPIGPLAARGWPLLLIPFAIFVALASDPEVWIFRQVTFRQVLGDPQLIEHQLGAVMVLVLAWLGWRNRGQINTSGPFSYALPIILLSGGILLLGHAHSTLNITEELTNLINYQHAIFGAFIITAGMVNWFCVRNLFPRKVANVVWPCCIIGLGLYMAFCYREAV